MPGRRVFAGLLVLVLAGISGFIGYTLGYSNGLASGGLPPGPYGPYPHYGWGFGFFGFLFPVFFLLLLVSLIGKAFFWGNWRGYRHGRGRWHDDPPQGPHGSGSPPDETHQAMV